MITASPQQTNSSFSARRAEGLSFRACHYHGIELFEESHEDWIDRISSQIRSSKSSCVRIHTINPEILAYGLKFPEYLSTLRNGTWNVIDGIWLSFAILLKKGTYLQRRCGSDLIDNLLIECEAAGLPFFMLGGTQERLDAALLNIRKRHPRLNCEGFSPTYSPDANLKDQAEIEALLRTIRPAVLAVCLGAPKQETWMRNNTLLLDNCGVKIAAGLGGTVDFLSGMIPRAPLWIRKIGMEWLFRALNEPFRFKRYWNALPALFADE